MQNQHEGCCKTGIISTTAAVKIENISMKAAIARISMRTPVAAANTVTDTAVVVMDRAVVDASDFGHGELRLVILDILTRDASHGYELIKAIENLTGGGYTPSAGVIYPTLDFFTGSAIYHD